jgi:hypothetical protein
MAAAVDPEEQQGGPGVILEISRRLVHHPACRTDSRLAGDQSNRYRVAGHSGELSELQRLLFTRAGIRNAVKSPT